MILVPILQQTGLVVGEVLFDVVRFPYWWYSNGLVAAAKWCWRQYSSTRARVSLGLWFKYFFTPMYGDYSLAGRFISLVMRVVMVVAKIIRLVVVGLVYLTILVGWIVLLPMSLFFILGF